MNNISNVSQQSMRMNLIAFKGGKLQTKNTPLFVKQAEVNPAKNFPKFIFAVYTVLAGVGAARINLFNNCKGKDEQSDDKIYKQLEEELLKRSKKIQTEPIYCKNSIGQGISTKEKTILTKKNGKMAAEKLPDTTVERRYYSDGKTLSEKFADGTEKRYFDDGKLSYEKLPDGTQRQYYYVYGRLEKETLPNGTYRWWHKNGQLGKEKLLDGTEKEYYENGQLQSEKLPDGTLRKWYENGNLSGEYLADGTSRMWDKNGLIRRESLSDGTIRMWDKNGNLL